MCLEPESFTGRMKVAARQRSSAVTPESDGPLLPMKFAIAIGARHGDHALRDKLDRALDQQRGNVRALLDRFGVPYEADQKKAQE